MGVESFECMGYTRLCVRQSESEAGGGSRCRPLMPDDEGIGGRAGLTRVRQASDSLAGITGITVPAHSPKRPQEAHTQWRGETFGTEGRGSDIGRVCGAFCVQFAATS